MFQLMVCFLLTNSSISAQIKGTYLIQTNERKVVGTPLSWDSNKLVLLSGYGQFDEVRLDDVKSYKKKSSSQLVYNRSSFSDSLKKEFGRRFSISQTKDYLVVHPQGQTDYWPKKIQYMFDAFQNYFNSRRISIRKRVYPLVAIVFPKKSDMLAYAKKHGDRVSSNIVGYYSSNSNRILIYDRSGSGKMTEQNLETVIHEIAHQAAFNCGIHRRFSDTPGWVIEGLGMLFEAKGVHDSFRHTKRASRVHSSMLYFFRNHMGKRKWRNWVGPLVIGDKGYAKDTERFYASAWALSFYLMETKPHDYVNYLKKTAKLPVFKTYTQKQRIADFERAFGSMDRLEGAIKNYFSQL